jgi:hypothetical protein
MIYRETIQNSISIKDISEVKEPIQEELASEICEAEACEKEKIFESNSESSTSGQNPIVTGRKFRIQTDWSDTGPNSMSFNEMENSDPRTFLARRLNDWFNNLTQSRANSRANMTSSVNGPTRRNRSSENVEHSENTSSSINNNKNESSSSDSLENVEPNEKLSPTSNDKNSPTTSTNNRELEASEEQSGESDEDKNTQANLPESERK